ncbi:MAG: NADH-quinone oxidoreductase subunit L [Acidobacteriia bacterium]|nr:NADH-quinone oxidoreductase subunit L [Terriglobia bacterium]
MLILNHLWIIPLLPLLGAAINGLSGLFGAKWPNKAVTAVAIGSTGLSFLAALECVREFLNLPAAQQALPWVKQYFTWIAAGTFRAGFDLQIDHLTIVMLLVVTGVGWLIHIYATGYMSHEGGYYRFFSYLNLFMFFMLILVMAANYVLLFVGWEGVGLASYLLIGFYFLKKSASDAGKKAFIVNRIGDFGFMLGMFLLFRTFGSLDFVTVFDKTRELPADALGQFGILTISCLLLFMGATGKSAQLPLYVWLPDAMEGPTPVSALIHAATMVTAGVYVVARSHILFTHAPTAMLVVASVGAATAFFAATIGLVQTDIKKILAYSTVSQLGYMFLACGVGAFSAGIFHLMTHAFFKALLFLAAGSVIHAMGGEQEVTRMGGLSGKIRWTYFTMLMGTLAIAGAPGFAGFFSKDAILFSAFQHAPGGRILYAVGLASALMTAFYMFRLIFLTFHGKPRFDEHHVHVHESPKSMLGPLVVLALLSIIGGWMAAPSFWGGTDHFTAFLAPVFGAEAAPEAATAAVSEAAEHSLELTLAGVAVATAFLGFFLAFWLYLRRPGVADQIAKSAKGAYTTLLNKYYVDELYAAVIIRPLVWISDNVLWRAVDASGIDGAVNGAAAGTTALGDRLRRAHSGNTRSYAVWVVIGALLILAVIFWPMLKPAAGMVP